MLKHAALIGLKDDRHIVTVAGSRAGKGRSMILPNLALYRGAVVVVDPKGENATLTAARRAALGQKVVVLDPFGVADVPLDLRGSFNPFDFLDTGKPSIVDDASLLAEALAPTGADKDAHWDESARTLLRALILHLVTTHKAPTLKTLRRFLMEGDAEGFAADCEAHPDEALVSARDYLLVAMSRNAAFDGAIAGMAATMLTTGYEERGSVFSTAARHTSFLDSLELAETINASNFAPDDLKNSAHGVSVYLCLPAHRIGTHGRWLRLMIAGFLSSLYQNLTPPASSAPVLFVLDEFAALGRMDVIEKAAGYAAGFGVKLWAILQDLAQLKALYPQSWETFLGNAGVLQFFGVSDRETTEFASKLAGDIETRRTVRNVSENAGESANTPPDQSRARSLIGRDAAHTAFNMLTAALSDRGVTQQQGRSATEAEGLHVVPLIRPDEIGRVFAREEGVSMLFIKGYPPIAMPRVNSDEDARIAALFPDTAERWVAQERDRAALITRLAYTKNPAA
jgi:type IV secretion system protein VirD4